DPSRWYPTWCIPTYFFASCRRGLGCKFLEELGSRLCDRDVANALSMRLYGLGRAGGRVQAFRCRTSNYIWRPIPNRHCSYGWLFFRGRERRLPWYHAAVSFAWPVAV